MWTDLFARFYPDHELRAGAAEEQVTGATWVAPDLGRYPEWRADGRLRTSSRLGSGSQSL